MKPTEKDKQRIRNIINEEIKIAADGSIKTPKEVTKSSLKDIIMDVVKKFSEETEKEKNRTLFVKEWLDKKNKKKSYGNTQGKNLA
jgi:hypothetical protein